MKTQKELLQEVHTVLLGVPGTQDSGLVGKVNKIDDCLYDLGNHLRTEMAKVNNKQNKLSRNFWLLVGILTGTGVIGSGIYSLLGG